MNNKLQSIRSAVQQMEKRICDLQDRNFEIQLEKKKGKEKKEKKSPHYLWSLIKRHILQ